MKQVILFITLLFFITAVSFAEETRATSILLDISRSLSPQEFEKLKTIIQSWIDQDSSKAHSLYTFGKKVKKVELDQLKTIQAIDSYTRLNDGAYDAIQDLKKESADKKSILIFSDGKDTFSATTVEDVISFAKSEGIAIYTIGIGDADRKSLERISKLTGGTFFSARNTNLIEGINSAISLQKAAPKSAPVEELPAPSRPAEAPVAQTPPTSSEPVATGEPSFTFLYIIAGLAIAGIVIFMMLRRNKEKRVCPTCNKPMESFQTTCPDCPGQTKILQIPEFAKDPSETAELQTEPKSENETVPPEWYEIKQETQEIMMKTSYLTESPVLIVTRGTNLGESYKLSKEAPVSIGRSRVNEIRPYDGSISAQHCRIIPEHGRHVLYDLGSTNGTLLNNQKVSKAILKEGDTISVGETILQYKIEHTR